MSTITQILQHEEEMEAARRDFQKFWAEQIEPLKQKVTWTKEQAMLFEKASWRCFVEGRLKP